MNVEEAFNVFLKDFMRKYQEKHKTLLKTTWELETTGTKEAALKVAILNKELKMLYGDEEQYKQLLKWKKEESITHPDLLRILNILIKNFKVHLVPESLIEDIAHKEAELAQAYVNFRVQFEGTEHTENDLIEILKKEKEVKRRQKAWEATKEIGSTLAPKIIALVKKRNQLAHRLGYSDFYKMKLDLDEVDYKWLFEFLNQFDLASKECFTHTYKEIEQKLAKRYNTTVTSIGPWAWSDPFCQEDPIMNGNLDSIIEDVDIVEAGKTFFHSIGFEVTDILERSDLFERPGKNQHAFCLNLDHQGDIRILTNIRPNMRWLETIIHELGHAVYEKGYDPKLHWYLRTAPHMITTEAIALITGRQAYDSKFLKHISKKKEIEQELEKAHESHRRRQVLFSRWVLVMVHFESALYANPEQDLNALWWKLVQKHQGICPPSHRGEKKDWACKMHIGLAPVYYHSYLLGEFFASMLKEHFEKESHTPSLFGNENIAHFLNEHLFFPGNRMKWDLLIESVMGQPIGFKPWINEFCK